jgi:two-component system chemotaxis response regulator CheY
MGTKNVLVVDDSKTTRMLISITLKKEKECQILEAADGKEAVARLDSEHVDVVITDMNMPKMNGLELIAYIRSQHCRPDIPIIMISTRGEEADRDRGLSLGANCYLPKPISGAMLITTVKEVLEKATQADRVDRS